MTVVDGSTESYGHYAGKYVRDTALGNFLGLCGISVPCGFTNDSLPLGLIIYARPFHENAALRIGHAYKQETNTKER